jgi:hypothetical protein
MWRERLSMEAKGVGGFRFSAIFVFQHLSSYQNENADGPKK